MPRPTNQRNSRSVVDPLDQLPLRADRVKRLQQQGPQQPLRRDRLPPERRIQRRKIARQRLQRCVGDLPDHPQRMIRRTRCSKIDIAEQTAACSHRRHASPPPNPHNPENQRCPKSATLFQHPARCLKRLKAGDHRSDTRCSGTDPLLLAKTELHPQKNDRQRSRSEYYCAHVTRLCGM